MACREKDAYREESALVDEGVDFEDFVPIADDAHWLKVLSERRMAGFAQAEIAQLEDMFKHYDKDGSGDIDSHEVQSLMEDFGMSCRTRQERDAVIDKMDLAKKLAQMYKVHDHNCIQLFGFKTAFGGGRSSGFGLIYDSIDKAKKFEPKYRLKRAGIGKDKKGAGRRAAKDTKNRRKKVRGKVKTKAGGKK